MSFMNSSSNSTHGKRTSDLPNMNEDPTGPPYDEFAGVNTMSQGANNSYPGPHAHGQSDLVFMDQYMGNAQSWAPPYVQYQQNMEPVRWTNMEQTGSVWPVNTMETSASYRSRSGKHQCRQCFSTFPTPSALETHFRTHTGEKPFSCTICKKAFSVASNLRRHERTHMASSAFENTDAAGNVRSTNYQGNPSHDSSSTPSFF